MTKGARRKICWDLGGRRGEEKMALEYDKKEGLEGKEQTHKHIYIYKDVRARESTSLP